MSSMIEIKYYNSVKYDETKRNSRKWSKFLLLFEYYKLYYMFYSPMQAIWVINETTMIFENYR